MKKGVPPGVGIPLLAVWKDMVWLRSEMRVCGGRLIDRVSRGSDYSEAEILMYTQVSNVQIGRIDLE